jgi:uncharacterized heparinase superfamily protein
MTRMVSNAFRLWHTVRHLKPVQVWARARRMVPVVPPRVTPAPCRRVPSGQWVHGPRRPRSLVSPTRIRLLNAEYDLPSIGWDGGTVDRLWRYHQHYFDDVTGEGGAGRADWHQDLISRWIAENPPGKGTGWEPYPTSRRIVNWIKMDLEGNRLCPDAAASLAVQARWLARHLEWHLLGNHLLANAKGLFFAGLFFEGAEPNSWTSTAVDILRKQIPEQVLGDGGHFERSPMYHAIVLEDFLDIVNLANAYARHAGDAVQKVVEPLRAVVAPMLRWLAAMIHPDGEIAFFNDSAFGNAPSYACLRAYATELGVPEITSQPVELLLLEESGFVRIEKGPLVAILDVGTVGPDYLPGHAHADTLSWELSFEGVRTLCNSGTSVYGIGPERQRQRGTAAHNTVTIDGADSSEVWAGFRVARRAEPVGLSLAQSSQGIIVSCGHNGYARLPGKPGHTRRWVFSDHSIEVRDQVRGPGQAHSHLHWHPHVAIENTADGAIMARLPTGRCLQLSATGMSLESAPSTWHPAFGVTVPCTKSVGSFHAGDASLWLRWS